jgi:hypothetical protein
MKNDVPKEQERPTAPDRFDGWVASAGKPDLTEADIQHALDNAD